MKGKLIKIVADMAHFKNSRSAVLQQTYKIPPISTVVGIIKNIYGENIQDFIFGYNFSYDFSQYEVSTIYKELNLEVKTDTDKERFNVYPAQIEYLINPKLEIIVVGLEEKYTMNTALNLGKTNCLAKLKIEDIEIKNDNIIQYNVLTDFKDGDGKIQRQNIETIYNQQKGYFDYYTKLIRINDEYNCKYSYEEQGVYLWKYNKVGEVGCYRELA